MLMQPNRPTQTAIDSLQNIQQKNDLKSELEYEQKSEQEKQSASLHSHSHSHSHISKSDEKPL